MRKLFGTAIVLLSLSVVAAAAAKSIVGTPKNDVLRGTKAADTISGKAGNDRLYGLGGNDRLIGGPGNDTLVGGPGADRLSCGAGKDVARADDADAVAGDCEVVKGRTPTEPPAPPAPPNVAPTARFTFSPTAPNVGTTITFDGTSSSDTDGTVTAYAWNYGDGSTGIGGTASHAYTQAGSYTVTLVVTDNGGSTGTATATVVVAAAPPPPPPPPPAPPLVPPGHYSITTSQGHLTSLDVSADGRTITSLSVPYTAPCQPPASFNSTAVLTGALTIASDRTFKADGSGTITGGTYTLTISGQFDAAGNVSGTLRGRVSATQNGTHYECDRDNVTFQGR